MFQSEKSGAWVAQPVECLTLGFGSVMISGLRDEAPPTLASGCLWNLLGILSLPFLLPLATTSAFIFVMDVSKHRES